MIRVVAFDAGETLFDESRMWEEVADGVGVPRFTLAAVVGGLIARGEHQGRAFELLGVDEPELLRGLIERSTWPDREDLYADAEPCAAALKEEGYALAVAGNFVGAFEERIRRLELPFDRVLSSETLGVDKPSPNFFSRLVEELGVTPSEVAYVGDRIDNDVVPAVRVGMRAVLVRRGPWAFLASADEGALEPQALVIDSLSELPSAIRRF